MIRKYLVLTVIIAFSLPFYFIFCGRASSKQRPYAKQGTSSTVQHHFAFQASGAVDIYHTLTHTLHVLWRIHIGH